MNRRRILSIAVAALAVSALRIGRQWITIAHEGKNLAGRVYSEAHIGQLFQFIKPGMKVLDWYCHEPGGDRPLGIVSGVRLRGDELQVCVDWIVPVDRSVVSFHGMMTPTGKALDGTQGFRIDEVLHLETSSGGSSFQRATWV